VTRETHGRSEDRRLVEGAAALDPADAEGARVAVRRLLEERVHCGSDLDDHAHPSERIYSLPVAEVAASEIFVVTETEMDGRGLVRWTEKTMKALATGLPFVVFGNAGVIAELRALGFDTLDDLVDHAYDAEAEPARRFVAARDALARFLARPPGFTPAEQARLVDAARHNGRVFTERLIEDVMLAPMARILAIAAG
jgi:hypothetical protein